MNCPICASTMTDSGGVFYERGEFDGASYTEEGSVTTYQCATCGMELAVIAEANEASTGSFVIEGKAEAHNTAGRLIEAGVPFTMQPQAEDRYEFRCAVEHRHIAQPRDVYGFTTRIAAVNIDAMSEEDRERAQALRVVFKPNGVWLLRPDPQTGAETDTGVLVENYIKDGTQALRVLAYPDGGEDDPIITNLHVAG